MKMFFKKLEEYIQMNHRYFDKDEREILFYSMLSSLCVCVCVCTFNSGGT